MWFYGAKTAPGIDLLESQQDLAENDGCGPPKALSAEAAGFLRKGIGL
jgi:hypothetical protein